MMKYGETRGTLWMKNSQNKKICKVMAFAALGVAQAVCISAAADGCTADGFAGNDPA